VHARHVVGPMANAWNDAAALRGPLFCDANGVEIDSFKLLTAYEGTLWPLYPSTRASWALRRVGDTTTKMSLPNVSATTMWSDTKIPVRTSNQTQQ